MISIEALPLNLVRTVSEHFGPRGRAFLEDLPGRLERLAARWGLALGEPFQDLSYHYVCRVTLADASPAVLKVGVPHDEMRNEITALRLLDGRGIERLYEADLSEGALLIERLEPGETLCRMADEDDDLATVTAAGVMRRLWRSPPAGHGLWDLDCWFRSLWVCRETPGAAGAFPEGLLDRAAATASELIDTTLDPVVLHGDLHHFNILTAQRAPWLAIDPKGLVGDRGFEMAAFLRNPDEKPPHVLSRRLDILAAELGLERSRAGDWVFVEQVLNACWSYEEGAGAECRRKIERAEVLLGI